MLNLSFYVVSYQMNVPGHDAAREESLLVRLQRGDEVAFTELYHLYKARIYYNLLRLVKSEEAAEELLQDTFLKVWERRASLDPARSFQSYLYRIAGNLAMDFYRKAALDFKLRAHLLATGAETCEPVEQGVIRKETYHQLHELISKLPVQRQRVFRLCRIEGKSYAETAAIMGISAGTVKDHLIKAGRFLREELRDEKARYLSLLIAAFTFA